MSHDLDTYPLKFALPQVKQLRALLIATFDNSDTISGLLKLADVYTGGINTARAPDVVWTDVLAAARKQDKLRVLLSVAAEDPNGAEIRPFLNSLLAETPAPPAPDTEGPAPKWEYSGDEGGLERQIESQSTLLDVSFLQRGVELSASIAKLVVTLNDGKRYYGTGFRVGPDLLLTNHHVLYDKVGPATNVEAWFGYERSFSGAERAHSVVPCVTASIKGRLDHDWAVVRTAQAMPDDAEIVPLIGAAKPAVLDRVYIIQHPKGEPKKIGMVHNVITTIDDDVIQYRADTEGGSSGSPVFNEQWQVIGLHHRWGSSLRAGRTEYYNQGQLIGHVQSALVEEGLI